MYGFFKEYAATVFLSKHNKDTKVHFNHKP